MAERESESDSSPDAPPLDGSGIHERVIEPTTSCHSNTSNKKRRLTELHTHVEQPMQIVESIKALQELYQQGCLTMQEFTQAKQRILDLPFASRPSSIDDRDKGMGRSERHRGRRHHGKHGGGARSSSSRDSNHRRGKRSGGSGSNLNSRSSDHGSFLGGSNTASDTSFSESSSSSTSSSSSSRSRFIVPRADVWRDLQVNDHELMASETFSPRYDDCCSEEAHVCFNEHGPASPCDRFDEKDMQMHEKAQLLADAENAISSPKRPRNRVDGTFGMPVPGDLNKYGTFKKSLWRGYGMDVGAKTATLRHLRRKPLLSSDVVHVTYFNSRGASGVNFSDVELKEEEIRDPLFLHKGVSTIQSSHHHSNLETHSQALLSRSRAGSTLASGVNTELPVEAPALSEGGQPRQPQSLMESRLWENLSHSKSSQRKSSYLEQSLNWYWVDVTGCDPGRRNYRNVLGNLTKKFNICKSFLDTREHNLMVPQVLESLNYPGQYLLLLRVATQEISTSADSILELTNRWIIIVDLRQHIIITLHRMDTTSMAELRHQWRKVMESSAVSFQEFLLKIIDDAMRTYQFSLDVHADLLDKCERKLFVYDASNANSTKNLSNRKSMDDLRILNHFTDSSRSSFLRKLLDTKGNSPVDKSELNNFLHHLHRRTSVQHRMLNVTQEVLAQAFTKLQLCSKEMAQQMCSNCIELRGRALEVREDAKTLLNLHISLQSFRSNELMMVLTRVALLFTPCTFLSGVYGMNFQYMPELGWRYGYLFFWCVSALLVIMMQWLFHRRDAMA
ncbi:unnamed protein product [Phytomonas sp. EM1]|nr:unnamed protein product [Phytomonas sp. EM1]|eukprot:CCW65304.1 unnamed protein product [Phytomonas sp. isolate EM1]